MNCNSTTHGTCPLALMMYKHIELQMSSAIQKLSCKANCNTPFFFHSDCTMLLVDKSTYHNWTLVVEDLELF